MPNLLAHLIFARVAEIWLGIALIVLVGASIFMLPSFIAGFDLGIASTNAIGIRAALFLVGPGMQFSVSHVLNQTA
ncbi:MAG: hypothetical protein WCA48_22940 [Pseudomonas gingeri]